MKKRMTLVIEYEETDKQDVELQGNKIVTALEVHIQQNGLGKLKSLSVESIVPLSALRKSK